MRLFKKEYANYKQPVHETVEIKGKTSYLKNEILHYTYKNIDAYIKRLNRYTTMEADMLKGKIGLLKGMLFLILKPFFRFLNLYILKQGFRDGIQGFLFSLFSGFYEFVKYSKLLLER